MLIGEGMVRIFQSFLFFLMFVFFSGCSTGVFNSVSTGSNKTSVEKKEALYRKVIPQEAKKMMTEIADYIILDVREREEYSGGHIKGASSFPLKSINEDTARKSIGSNKDRVVFVYCQGGFRSKKAADMLVRMGYSNVWDLGGIVDWSDELE